MGKNSNKGKLIAKLKEIFVFAINKDDFRNIVENNIEDIVIEYKFNFKIEKSFNIIDAMIDKINNGDYAEKLCKNCLFDVINVDALEFNDLVDDLRGIYVVHHKDTFDIILRDIGRSEYGK